MRQIQDKQIIYVDSDFDRYSMTRQPDYDVVYVQRRPRRRVFDPFVFIATVFWLGVFGFMLLSFVVDSPEWLLKRAALGIVFLLVGAFVFAILFSILQGIRETFFWWRDDG